MRSYALLPLAAVAMAFEAPPPLKNQIAGPILGIYAMCGNDPIDCGQGWCCLNGQQCVTDAKNNIMCYDPDLSQANNEPITVDPAYFGTMMSGQATPSHASSYASQTGGMSMSTPATGATTILVAAPGASSAASAASAASKAAAGASGASGGSGSGSGSGSSPTFAAPSSVQTIYGDTGAGHSNSTNGASNVSSNGAIVMSNDAATMSAHYQTGLVALVGSFMAVLAWL